MTLEPPPEPPARKDRPARSRIPAISSFVGLAAASDVATFLGTLQPLLPSSSALEKTISSIVLTALSAFLVFGYQAWFGDRRSARGALGAAVVTITALGLLVKVSEPIGETITDAGGNPTSNPTPPDASPSAASRADPLTPSTSSPPTEPTEPTPNPPQSSAQPDDGDALYLADVNGVDWRTGSWTVAGHTYAHSLGVNPGCLGFSDAVLDLGDPYRRIIAEVGIDDATYDFERDVDLEVTVYRDLNNDGLPQSDRGERVKSVDVRYGRTTPIDWSFDAPEQHLILRVDFVGAGGCLHSDVVWGEARVLP